MTLSLDRQPAADVIKGTAGTWLEALTAPRTWAWDEEVDRPRIRAAFSKLAAECIEWPKPRQFLDALPPLPKPFFTMLGRERGPATISPRVQAIIDELGNKLRATS